ncbi:extracellular solute-binding protein [Liquorilactobacillus vini]|uniref:extracellular solute-binding protein n=1 Tax=Liquorilactobacillus vini TaxID=238015 RepID=UPI000315FD2D|nr:extracellular solute-binding protein [Liquorilactobacillus vini]
MRKSFKRLGMLALAAGLTFSLAACGNSSSSSNSKKQTLTVSVDNSSNTYKKFVNQIKGKFEKKYNVKVKVRTKAMSDQLDALKLDGPAGKAPDVMMAAYDNVGVLGKQGQLAPVKLVSGRYSTKDKKLVTMNGKYYGEPATIETMIMYYNKKYVKTAPTNFKQLEAISKDSKYAYANDKTKNVGFLVQWTNFYDAYGLIKGYGGYVFGGKDNKNINKLGLNNAGAVEGLTYITNWFKNVWPKGMQSTTSNENFITSQFTGGKTAVVLDGPWMAATYNQTKSLDYAAAKIPTLDNGKEYQPFGGGKAWVISKYSKHQSLSQKWLNYVTNNQNQEKFNKMTLEVPANETARKSAAKASGIRGEVAEAVLQQFKSAEPMPNMPAMTEVWTGAQNLIVNAASGKKTPKQSADAAVKEIAQTIKQKYSD